MLQQLINILYRHPKSRLNNYRRFGGYRNYQFMLRNSLEMKKEAYRLPPVISHIDGYPIYFLTGDKYLYQTLFCIHSLQKCSAAKFRFVLVDDGTINEEVSGRIAQGVPGAQIVTSDEIHRNLEIKLPEARFPALHRKRRIYPHIKKLTDIHTLPQDHWKLVLDSDMLFWAEPKELTDWLAAPGMPVSMLDCSPSYGYSAELMERLCGTPVQQLINVGVIGLNSSDICWTDLEAWTKQLEETEGASYFLEQALTAMLIGNHALKVLDPAGYVVNPDSAMVDERAGVLHHYVDLSKELYFKKAWKLSSQF